MGARKDLCVSYSSLTQEEVEAFYAKWGIDSKFNPEALSLDKSIDQCPAGSIALYCRHFEFSNLRHPFPDLFSVVLHFEVLCRALGYDPTLLLFRRFFRLAKNGDWFTFETSQIDVCLISSMRHPDVVLNELEPSESEFDSWFLTSIGAYPSRLHPFLEHLLVLMGFSTLWDKPDRDPALMRGGQVTSALDFIRVDDTSDVVFRDAEATKGDDVVIRGVVHRFEVSGYVNVLNVKGFTKATASKASTRRSTRRMLKGAEQLSSFEPVDLSDDIETSDDLEVRVERKLKKNKELPLVVGKESKATGKKVTGLKDSGKSVEGSANVNPGEVYVLGWKVTVGDSFKSSSVCEGLLTYFAPPAVRDSCSSMDDDQMISKMMMGAYNLASLLPKGISRFRKRMQEYEAFSKKRDGIKASMAALKKEREGFSEEDKPWMVKVGELTSRHETEVNELKKQIEALSVREKASSEEKEGLKASLAQVTSDNKWLIKHGFQ
ncbi:hypothetical protein Hanom_Chr16g01483981 [Helianthus anomalus]